MASTNGLTTSRAIHVAAGIAGLAILACLLFWWWSTPPQMGDDEEVSSNVDALFTAVTARDGRLLADCEGRLLLLKDAGRLPLEASGYLDTIISKARAGRWQPAAETLYDFIRAQRREGAHEHPRKESLAKWRKK